MGPATSPSPAGARQAAAAAAVAARASSTAASLADVAAATVVPTRGPTAQAPAEAAVTSMWAGGRLAAGWQDHPPERTFPTTPTTARTGTARRQAAACGASWGQG